MIKKFFKKLLPLPAQKTHERFDILQDRLAELHVLAKKLENMVTNVNNDMVRRVTDANNDIARRITEANSDIVRSVTDANNDMARRVTDANRDVNRQLDDTGQLLLKEIQHFMGMWQEEVVASREKATASYMYSYIKKLRDMLKVMDVADTSNIFCRVGRDYDGGYTMLEDFNHSSIAYSIGICDDVSWDKDMADRGLDVYMYDHTIDSLPEENEKFHWYKIGLTGTYHKDMPYLKTLPMLLKENGHADMNGMILKMDIEGAEWDVLAKLDSDVLGKFSQIVFEFHDLNNVAMESVITAALKNLNDVQQLVHVHGNNWEGYKMVNGLVLPDALECTYLNRQEYNFCISEKFFPLVVDQVNNPCKPEIVLGKW